MAQTTRSYTKRGALTRAFTRRRCASPPTLSLLTAADRTLVFHSNPPARFLSFPSFPGSACPRGGENRSAAWVDLSGAVAIKNSPVSGAWIADGTTTTTTTIPARMVRSLPGSRAIGLTPAKGGRRGCNPGRCCVSSWRNAKEGNERICYFVWEMEKAGIYYYVAEKWYLFCSSLC